MKSSFCTIAFQKNKRDPERRIEKPLAEILPIVAESGFGGVEIWHGHIMWLDESQREPIRQQIRELNLEVAMFSPYFDFTTSDETAEASLKEAAEVLAEARRLGSRGIRIFTGKTGGQEATGAQWERAVKCLQQLADQTRDDHIVWACETHANNLMDDVESSLRLIREVDRENVRLIFQPSTFNADYLRALDLLGPFICHVHATNYRDGQRVALGDGEMNYRQIITGLRRYSFEGFISIEWMGDDPEAMARREGPYLSGLID